MAGSVATVAPTTRAGTAESRSACVKSWGRIQVAMAAAIGGRMVTTPTMPYQSYTPEPSREKEKNQAALLTGPPMSKASMAPTRKAATSFIELGMELRRPTKAFISQAMAGPMMK